jgi:hypothetical protein
MKATIEWKSGDLWHDAEVEVSFSQHNNYWFKHDGKIFVFAKRMPGCEVLVKEGAKWIRVGRCARGVIFLGEGLTYAETAELKFKNETVLPKVVFA